MTTRHITCDSVPPKHSVSPKPASSTLWLPNTKLPHPMKLSHSPISALFTKPSHIAQQSLAIPSPQHPYTKPTAVGYVEEIGGSEIAARSYSCASHSRIRDTACLGQLCLQLQQRAPLSSIEHNLASPKSKVKRKKKRKLKIIT